MPNTLTEKTQEINEEKGLPQGWVECELGEVFTTSSGGTPKRGESSYYGGSIPWIKSGELNNGIITTAEEYITDEGLAKSSAKLFPKGSLLIALYGATVGKLAFLGIDATTNQAICCIYKNDNYNLNFLFYYLSFKKDFIINLGKGGAQPNISQEIIKALEVPFPPLPEQVRIVEKIEELFSNIDAGIEKLEQAKLQIKQYKQSVLKSAFEGKLYKTTEWEEVIISKVAEVNPKTELPDINDNEDVSFLPMPAVKAEINYYVEEKAKFGKVKKGYTRFQDNDVLFAKITPCMENGKSCVVKDLKYGVGFGSTEFHVIRCSEQLLPEFIFHFIVQENYRKTAKGFMSGAVGQQRVPKDYLQNTEFNLPKIEEQQKIVEEIEKRFEAADILEKAVIEGLEKSKQLKQSILKKAFEGRLVPQDPNDEPASILLEKIKAEKAAIESNAKQSKKKTKGGKNA